MSSSKPLQCLVSYHYEAKRDDELTINVGDVITNVTKREGGWWFGEVGGRQGFFPSNFVKPQMQQKLAVEAGKRFIVKYPYKPVNMDELELREGEVVEVFEEDEPGWWKGQIGDKCGVFPSNFVHPLSESSSPVVLRRNNSSEIRALRSTKNNSITFPVNVNFDPEVEPHEQMFGSLAWQLDKGTDLNNNNKIKTGFFSKIRHSFGGKYHVPELFSGRLSSNSLFETRSTSSYNKKQRSLKDFFTRPFHSTTSSKQELQKASSCSFDIRTDPATYVEPSSVTVQAVEGEFRRMRISSDFMKVGKEREDKQSGSWVWQEMGSNNSSRTSSDWLAPSTCGLNESNNEDSWSDDGLEFKLDTSEEVFGPIKEITDEVFGDMFNTTKSKSCFHSTSTSNSHNQGFEFSETPEEDKVLSKKLTKSNIKTSFSNVNPEKKGKTKRSFILTNPFCTSSGAGVERPRVQITKL